MKCIETLQMKKYNLNLEFVTIIPQNYFTNSCIKTFNCLHHQWALRLCNSLFISFVSFSVSAVIKTHLLLIQLWMKWTNFILSFSMIMKTCLLVVENYQWTTLLNLNCSTFSLNLNVFKLFLLHLFASMKLLVINIENDSTKEHLLSELMIVCEWNGRSIVDLFDCVDWFVSFKNIFDVCVVYFLLKSELQLMKILSWWTKVLLLINILFLFCILLIIIKRNRNKRFYFVY